MQKIDVTLETMTPLFLGGAGGKTAPPELRPPAFRGAMRYWLRAALGGIIGDDENAMKTIVQLEGKVFGSVREESSNAASEIVTRIANSQMMPYITYQRESSKNAPPTGKDYLYWSMFVGENAYYYPPGGKFDLILNSRPGLSDSQDSFTKAIVALWLLIHLGGIGSRSHRTAGSLSVQQVQTIEKLQFGLVKNSYAEMAKQLGDNISKIRAILQTPGSTGIQWDKRQAEFDILHPDVCQIWLLGAWGSADVAIENIGKRLQEFRNRRDPDHRNVAKWSQGESIPTVERAAFGLPLGYRYTNGLSGTIQGRLGRDSIERRASPLWLSISRIDSKVCIATATLFKSRFLPEGEKLYAKKSSNERLGIAIPKDYTLINKWITESFPKAVEVYYV